MLLIKRSVTHKLKSYSDTLSKHFSQLINVGEGERQALANTLLKVLGGTSFNFDSFGSKEVNDKSFEHWMIYSRTVTALSILDSDRGKPFVQKLRQEMAYLEGLQDPLQYEITREKDSWNYYEGLWRILTTFNPDSKDKLLKLYKGDRKASQQKCRFWQHFDFNLSNFIQK